MVAPIVFIKNVMAGPLGLSRKVCAGHLGDATWDSLQVQGMAGAGSWEEQQHLQAHLQAQMQVGVYPACYSMQTHVFQIS